MVEQSQQPTTTQSANDDQRRVHLQVVENVMTGHCAKCDSSGLLYWAYDDGSEVDKLVCYLCKERMERT